MNLNDYLIKKSKDGEYFAYNPITQLPVIFNEQGRKYFELYCRHKEVSSCKRFLSKNEFEEFENLISSLSEVNFFNTKEIPFEKKEYNLTKGIRFFINLTNKCNLACSYCFNEEYRNSNYSELSISNWKQIIDKIINYTSEVVITGGEPTLYNGLLDILKYLREKKPDVKIEMFSNGNTDFSAKPYFTEVFGYIDKLNLSCDSVTEEDLHLRNGFSLDIFLTNIKWLKKNYKNENILINAVWNNENLDAVKKVQEFTKSNDINFSFSLQLPRTICEAKYLPDIDQFNHCLMNKTLNSGNITSDVNEEEMILKILRRTTKCSAANKTFSIDNNGNCFPCQAFHFEDFKLGNLLDNSLEEIYYSEPAIELRNNCIDDIEKCKDCKLKYKCAGGCIADTYKLHGSIKAYPEILCKYYESGTIHNLLNMVEYE